MAAPIKWLNWPQGPASGVGSRNPQTVQDPRLGVVGAPVPGMEPGGSCTDGIYGIHGPVHGVGPSLRPVTVHDSLRRANELHSGRSDVLKKIK